MDYDALMAFATFAKHRNFTHAAKELFISQPALHQKVSKLADQLGTQLYTKCGRELMLTEEGQMLAVHARQVAALTDDVLQRVRDEEARAPVVLASGPGAFLHLLGPAIIEAQESPYRLELWTMMSPAATKAVLEARAHVAVAVFHEQVDELELHPWCEIGQMVVMPEGHRLAKRNELTPEDLEGEALVIAPAGGRHRMSTEAVLAEHNVSWHSAVEATGWDLMVRFVSYGLGITIINDFVPVPEGLVGVPVRGFPSVRYSVAVRRDTPHQGARWLLELLLGSS